MIELSAIEARIVGALIEKEVTTPDQYPLSLKSLTAACNQKSNREPVMNLSEIEVQNAVDDMAKKNLVAPVVFGSRVNKYKHRFCNTEFSKIRLSAKELGIICVMLLRGPQTPGELRSRTNRLCDFDDVSEVETILQQLADREEGAMVSKLEREPGKRESRYSHLFYDQESLSMASSPATDIAATGASRSTLSQTDRIALLEDEVASLRSELDELKQKWQELVE
ncbi:YceH family protein [Agarilytica rhodophyticola]|uniref:YceH family protein n=1 Tax=Agarilytica rhodophyticola TaxID=1737490 RepID=UPI000B34762A|nr:DUF480 domain-containing protein [Agarilytica rhodophyticola]